MEFKEGEIFYKFSIKGVRKVRITNIDDYFVTLQDINNPLTLTYPINHPELMFVGSTHKECVQNTRREIRRIATIKLYDQEKRNGKANDKRKESNGNK